NRASPDRLRRGNETCRDEARRNAFLTAAAGGGDIPHAVVDLLDLVARRGAPDRRRLARLSAQTARKAVEREPDCPRRLRAARAASPLDPRRSRLLRREPHDV